MENKISNTLADQIHLLKRSDVEKMTSLSKTSIYNLIKEGDFPSPIRLLDNKVAWVDQEVQAWIMNKIAASKRCRIN
jgi:prophage regulatory protein